MTCQYPGSAECGDIGTAVSLHGGVLPVSGLGLVGWVVVACAAIGVGAAWGHCPDRGLACVFTVGMLLAVALVLVGQVGVALFTVLIMAIGLAVAE